MNIAEHRALNRQHYHDTEAQSQLNGTHDPPKKTGVKTRIQKLHTPDNFGSNEGTCHLRSVLRNTETSIHSGR
jgi:hypothetical protein